MARVVVARASATISTVHRGGCRVLSKALDSIRFVYNHVDMEPSGYTKDGPARLDATFLALADPTRRAILARLAHGEASVTELAAPFRISQPAISKHLKVLERAGLVRVGQDAQRRPRRLDTEALQAAGVWIEQCRAEWEANYQRLDRLLAELQRDDRPGGRAPRKTSPRARRG